MNEEFKLYVGNLPYSMGDDQLRDLFAQAEGVEVVGARVITDKNFNNRSKGFGFVSVASDEQRQLAITALNGKEIEGRALRVDMAQPQAPRDRDNNRRNFR